LVFVEATSFNGYVDFTLYVYGATLVGRAINKLRVLDGQVHITSEENKGAHLIALRSEVCHLRAVRTAIGALSQRKRCPRGNHCRGPSIASHLVSCLAPSEVRVWEIVKACVSNRHRSCRANVYVFRELLCIVELEEAPIDKDAST